MVERRLHLRRCGEHRHDRCQPLRLRRASRLRSGTVYEAGPTRKEVLTYDAADNVTSIARDGGVPIGHHVDAATNRLLGRGTATDIVYDAAGSVTNVGL